MVYVELVLDGVEEDWVADVHETTDEVCHGLRGLSVPMLVLLLAVVFILEKKSSVLELG